MAERKEELKPESLDEMVQEIKGSIFRLFEMFLPPEEVRREVMKNIYTIELSFLRIFKTLLDYQVSELEKKIQEESNSKKKKAKKIEVE